MKYCKFLFFLVVVGFLSCKGNAQPDNTKPMYGEVPKNDYYKKADEDFKKQMLEQYGTADSAAKAVTDNAWIYFYHNDLKTAMKRFNQAWLLSPDFPDSYFGFAALMDMQNNISEAKRFYEIGLEKDSTKARAKICYQRIADCKEQLQNFQGAIDACAKLVEISPNDAFAFKNMGYLQSQLGNFEDALTAYTKAIELDLTDAMTYNNRAYVYQTEKNYKDAIADYTKAIQLDSKDIGAYVNRGIALMAENDFAKAKKDFETCVRLDGGKSGALRRILGQCELSLKDTSGACADFKLAKELGDSQADSLSKQNCK